MSSPFTQVHSTRVRGLTTGSQRRPTETAMSPKEEPVAIETLDASQLSKLKESVAQEVERLASSSIQLQRASGAFENRGRAISSLADTKEGIIRQSLTFAAALCLTTTQIPC